MLSWGRIFCGVVMKNIIFGLMFSVALVAAGFAIAGTGDKTPEPTRNLRNGMGASWSGLTGADYPLDILWKHGCAHAFVSGTPADTDFSIVISYASGGGLDYDNDEAPDGLRFNSVSTSWAYMENLPDEVYIGIRYNSAPDPGAGASFDLDLTPCANK